MDSPPESQTGNVPQIQKESHQKRPSAILRARLSFQTCRCENIFPLLTLIFNTNFAYDEPLPGASGQKLRLKDYSPDDKSLFSGTKEESLIEFDKLREELQELQKKLFAQHKHKILVILQAMDAGGKDGCVKHVFSRVDPQGLHVVPFKNPLLRNWTTISCGAFTKKSPPKGRSPSSTVPITKISLPSA